MSRILLLSALILCGLSIDDGLDAETARKKSPYNKRGPAARYKPLQQKGPCEQTMECKKKYFGIKAKAPCLGYYSCFRAEFATKEDIKCIGSSACQKATFYGKSSKVVCSGHRSCESTRGAGVVIDGWFEPGLMARILVSCDGAFACNSIPGGIYAKDVKCDGDAACSNVNPVAMKQLIEKKKSLQAAGDPNWDISMPRMSLFATRSVTCNGKAVCRENRIFGEKQVYCDGDGACRKSTITAPRLRCHGKRACESAEPVFTQQLEAYGFLGAADSKIITKDSSQTLRVLAYGFNALRNAEILPSKGSLKLFAYGWRSAYGAKVYCASADCEIECWSTACKSMTVYYKNADDDVTITPSGCHPNSPDYAAKVLGVNCPVFERANNRLQLEAYGTPQSVLDPDFDVDAVQSMSILPPYPASLQAEIDESLKEYAELNEAEDKAMDQYLTDLINDLDDDMEQALLENDEETVQNNVLFDAEMTVQSLKQNTISSDLVVSNVATALLVFIAFTSVAYYYPKCHLAQKGELSPLMP